MSETRVSPGDGSSPRPDRRAPLGSWRRAYAAVVVFFFIEVVFFAWLTWTVS